MKSARNDVYDDPAAAVRLTDGEGRLAEGDGIVGPALGGDVAGPTVCATENRRRRIVGVVAGDDEAGRRRVRRPGDQHRGRSGEREFRCHRHCPCLPS
jgi:hypothetical protein